MKKLARLKLYNQFNAGMSTLSACVRGRESKERKRTVDAGGEIRSGRSSIIMETEREEGKNKEGEVMQRSVSDCVV